MSKITDINHLAGETLREDGEGLTRIGAGEFADDISERLDAALSPSVSP